MKDMGNVGGPKYQRGHGKHSFDPVSWRTSSKAQDLLGQVTSNYMLIITAIFMQKTAKY